MHRSLRPRRLTRICQIPPASYAAGHFDRLRAGLPDSDLDSPEVAINFRRVPRQAGRSFELMLDLGSTVLAAGNRHNAASLVRPPAGAAGEGCLSAPFEDGSEKAACTTKKRGS